MRDYLVAFVVLGSLPIGLFRPYYGILVYTWISFMYPHLLAWGFVQTLPVAKMSALSVLAGLLITQGGETKPLRQRENVAMIILLGIFTFSSLFAINSDWAWNKWQDVVKLIFMALVVSSLLKDQQKLRYVLLVIAFSLGFYGIKGGIFSVLTGGEQMVWGPGTSILAGNNAMGLALNMALPFFWYLAQEERGYAKLALYAMFFLSIPSIMFTYSRASAITMPIVVLAIILRGRHRTLLLVSAVVVAVLAVPFVPQKFWDRQASTLTYEQDGSAMSRIDNWKFCWSLALDRPLTGGGFEFNSTETFARYAPEFLYTYGGKTWDTHNIYFAMLAAHGFPGFIMFVLMIVFCFMSCRRLRKLARGRDHLKWVINYTRLVEVSFMALLINGCFVNMEYFDLVYYLVAFVASMKVICYRELSVSESEGEMEPDFARELVPSIS